MITYVAGLAATGLVASVGAFWAGIRVGVELYDHLIFWASMVGVVNLATLTATCFECWLGPWLNRVGWQRRFGSIAIAAFVAVMAAHGARHIALEHHLQRFDSDRERVRQLSEAVSLVVQEKVRGSVIVDTTPEAWSVAAGIILKLYQDGVPLTVHEDWVTLFGSALAPSGTETFEIVVADLGRDGLSGEASSHELVASHGDIGVFMRPLRSSP